MKKLTTAWVILWFPLLAFATPSAWVIVPSQSHLSFTAIQNDSPLTGQFNFKGEGHFDPQQLEASNVTVTIDLASVKTSYQEADDMLKNSDWFDILHFPQATFTAKKFVLIPKTQNHYEAPGTLTIRNKTLPVTLHFVLDKYTNKDAHATGELTLRRTQFGVGQGEWASTSAVKDDVKVNFDLTAVKKEKEKS
jgi:polyisoprenoid-binding protein YceI